MYYWSSSKNLRCESHIVTPTVGWSWPCTAMLKVRSAGRRYCVYKQHWDAVIGETAGCGPGAMSVIALATCTMSGTSSSTQFTATCTVHIVHAQCSCTHPKQRLWKNHCSSSTIYLLMDGMWWVTLSRGFKDKGSSLTVATVEVHFSARVLFMRIMRIKRRLHKFLSHNFLSRHISQYMKSLDA
jgi:hypothetical protein